MALSLHASRPGGPHATTMATLPGDSPYPRFECRSASNVPVSASGHADADNAASDAAGADTDTAARNAPGTAAGHADHCDAECRAASCNFARRAIASARAGDERRPRRRRGALPPGVTVDTLNTSVQGEPPADIRALGPVISVSGCLRGTGLGHENETFTLESAAPAEALTDAQPPQGVNAYRLLGIAPDLKRHVGERVEVIGLIQDAAATDGSAPLALDVKSVVATDKCPRQQ